MESLQGKLAKQKHQNHLLTKQINDIKNNYEQAIENLNNSIH